jgi:2-amino-4-hydroxy-6-hydroxymethyldihydropteridine diphosphokinase
VPPAAETRTAWIALGSNLGDRAATLRSASRALASLPDTTLKDLSPVYRSRAIGPGDQADYLNAVARLSTRLAPGRLLEACLRIEREHGRERGERWAARTLDLDLLMVDDLRIEQPGLTLPHPRLEQRNFVVFPLADLDPDLPLHSGTTAGRLRTRLGADGLARLADFRF